MSRKIVEVLIKGMPPTLALGGLGDVADAAERPMGRLNGARRELKHHGTHPSPREVEGFRASVTSFLEDNTRAVFGIDYDRISLVDLVTSADIRGHLEAAEASIRQNDFDAAAATAAIAFAKLLDEYDPVSELLEERPPERYPRRIGNFYDGYHALPKDEETSWAADSVEYLLQAVRVLALGLDYRRFRRFADMTPAVSSEADQSYFVSVTPSPKPRTREDCEEALAFVVDCALRVQQ